MKSFSFKILYIGVFAPSILYILTLPYLGLLLQHDFSQAIRKHLIQNEFDLLQGKVSLYDEVNRNVLSVLKESRVVQLGAEIRVRITDQHENIIYPYYERFLFKATGEETLSKSLGPLFNEDGFALNSERAELETFLQDYSDYIQGMNILARVEVPVTSWLGSGILLGYILLTVVVLYLYYQRSTRLEELMFEEKLETEKRTAVEQVEHSLQEARKKLTEIQSQEEEWLEEVERLEKEKDSLEEELIESLEQTEEQKEKIEKLEGEMVRQTAKKPKASREERTLYERFKKLYRNLEIDQKVVNELVQLGNEKLKLQAEEVLKRLNDGDPSLKIRRKIAGVERCDAYELGFGSSGRIYYIPSETRQFKVLRIGTKASQSKDLAYLQGKSK